MNLRLRHVAAYLTLGLSFAYASHPLSAAPQQNTRAQQDQLKADMAKAFRIPKFELAGKLSKIFKVSRCEYISGLTCRIHYNGKLPLPSEVFFTEFDDHGKKAGPRVRLIYPELNPGETGIATFRIRLSSPAKIVLEGEWNGPWRDPY
jgi:hypothetical protein